jgi:copper resistance protein C
MRGLPTHAALAILVLAGLIAPAGAHAFLDHADPSVGSTLKLPPARVRIWFTEALEPAFSSIAVTDAAGRPVGRGSATVDAADAMLLELDLMPLAAGTYRVRWRVVSVDTHPTEGDFTFTVKP